MDPYHPYDACKSAGIPGDYYLYKDCLNAPVRFGRGIKGQGRIDFAYTPLSQLLNSSSFARESK